MSTTARWCAALAAGVAVLMSAAAGFPTVAAAGPRAGAATGPTVGPMIPAPPTTGTRAQATHPVELSTNWSGYAATSPSKFNSVQGDFVQPAIVCTGAPALFMAAWVGLDGFKDKTVEQDGTFATCRGPGHKTPTYLAWYEMFPASSVVVFPISAGDEIEPAVTYADDAFTLTVTDVTSGQSHSVTAACKSCHRASAEWIIERPELCNKGGCFLAALPDYDTAVLSADTAGTDVAPAAPVSSFANTPLDMIQPDGASVEVLNQTDPLGTTGDVFTSVWERSGGKLAL